ncbi:MAG: ATP phosphoribosyltransferase [Caldanaerobacter subterraneus]|uniref:ATP phosphoribosyltransferase n=3 Tax=Caldanaerobacter subterraneus TaxID=911092 RepID=HIS1_CALS4|nr:MULTISPECIES: ATP phosphoribosyltransferase [Caldanaerobacter]Q8R881.1 RecName: Full=ATP phosphoribosyltransferase; Short=ATP-PRT; Short=ATP-PRTase [Caldanaerobacter subterraneus subsp. tengcongensis MB4]AAM25304.1 ATP phosphoribosyltransferase (histidine biosynthesis) [Caldanaerobacter subterraneus subsp. tengcongensis MB4]KKC29039.1 ATP phosphoribosyltransferase catalytic subunit [Caldanaerobacter subterraneus subsp. pacificus DSM 12653]KUK09604.1 MAG: ATP phosphoribosyltransferase [Caldan
MDIVSIALPKGRMTEDAVVLFKKAGISNDVLKDISRKLILEDNKNAIKFMLVKPMDVPTYVEHGAADLGVCGKDILLEQKKDLYEVLDLKFGFCRMVVAGPPNVKDSFLTNKRVATKFPNVAEEFFKKKGENVEIIKLNGSVELAPIVGLSEVIVDIVETGRTLRENGLVVIEEIFPSTARLIVNKASMKTKSERIKDIILKLREVINGG